MKNNNIIYRYITVLALASAYANAVYAQQHNVPKLVVNITVDQLRSDYMDTFCSFINDGGFNRLLKGGRVYNDAHNNFFPIDCASSTAVISTGSTPYYNGIIASSWLNRETLNRVQCTDDKKIKPGTNKVAASASAMLTSTVGDELKVASQGVSKVFSIAPGREAAILAAGHAADCALWIDDRTGEWTTSDYYSGADALWVTTCRSRVPVGKTISKEKWAPISGMNESFSLMMGGAIKKAFSHSFTGERAYINFKHSALVNEKITDATLQCLNGNSIGIDDATDLICVNYYAGMCSFEGQDDYTMELQDTYLRLDCELRRLIEQVEKKVGKDKVLFVLTSTGYLNQSSSNYAKYGVPSGTFYINRTANILNMYLSSLYGRGQYVDATCRNQIFLNRKFIEQQHVSLPELLIRSKQLLVLSEGVIDVYSFDELLNPTTDDMRRARNAYKPSLCGDLIVEVAPGWNVLNEETGEKFNVDLTPVAFPIIFYGADIVPQETGTYVTTEHIAPTICKSLRIRAPNGCRVLPLF